MSAVWPEAQLMTQIPAMQISQWDFIQFSNFCIGGRAFVAVQQKSGTNSQGSTVQRRLASAEIPQLAWNGKWVDQP
jgi:hypothetical protein